MKNSFALKTYAKINLSLDVTGVREDGYHQVAMVMQAIDLYDEMRVRILEADTDRIILKTDKYYVPTDRRNTAWKAADLMAREYLEGWSPEGDEVSGRNGGSGREIRIDIGKTIPVAAGLAGGSSNAAGVIVAMDRILGLGLSLDDMCRLGTKVGADVPFCILAIYDKLGIGKGASTCALAEGLGEILTPLTPVKSWVLLAKPPAGASTKEVYGALDSLSEYPHPDTAGMIAGVKAGNMPKITASMGNVLESVTMNMLPEVKELKELMSVSAAGSTMMSGSGPTVYSLFGSKNKGLAARKKLEDLEKRRYEVFFVKTLV